MPAWHGRAALRSDRRRRRLSRPCRIYAPVGSHETLLAYLVRRLLENGANTSFVNRIADASVPIEALLEDPVEAARDARPARRAASEDRAAARPVCAGARQFGRPRSQQRSAARRACRSARDSARSRIGAPAASGRRFARDRQSRRRARHRRPRRRGRAAATSNARSRRRRAWRGRLGARAPRERAADPHRGGGAL